MISQQKIDHALEGGLNWLKSKQNADGSYGDWEVCSTSLALLALLGGNVPDSDPAVSKAIAYILNAAPPDSTYFRSLTVIALTASGERNQDILSRVESDAKWLMQSQGSEPAKILSFGGWDHFHEPERAVAFNTQHAIYALYSAASWGIKVSQETWERALNWYQRNYDVYHDGSFIYGLGDPGGGISENQRGVVYTATAGVLSSLKIINLLSTDPEVQSQAQKLLDRALAWLSANYTIDLDMGDSSQYQYLLNLQRGCVLEPSTNLIGTHEWSTDIINYLLTCQKPAGNWPSTPSMLDFTQLLSGQLPSALVSEKTNEKIVQASLALLALTGAASFAPAKTASDRVQVKQDQQESTVYGAGTGREKSFKARSEWKEENGIGHHQQDKKLTWKSTESMIIILGIFLFSLAGIFTYPAKSNDHGLSLSFTSSSGRHPAGLVGGEGKITPATKDLYGKIPGIVDKIWITQGSIVEAGQVIMNINPGEIEFELDQVKAEIEKCLVKLNNLSSIPGLEVKSGFEGVITGVYCKPGEKVTADKPLATLRTSRVLDVTLEIAGFEYYFIDKGVPAELYFSDGKIIYGVLFLRPSGQEWLGPVFS
jgi:hypothetical protein